MDERQNLLGKSPDKPKMEQEKMNDRYLTGLILLLTVVVMWTASNFIVAGMETGDDGWNKPFLFTYLNTAPYALYLLPTYWRYRRGQLNVAYEPLAQEERPRTRRSSPSRLNIRRSPSAATSRRGISRAESNILTDPTFVPDPEDKLGVKETAGVAVWWGIVWFIGNWLNNTALGLTSVASMTIIATTSGFFTLALGRICRVETLSRTKIIASVVSFLGVILVTQSDSSISSTDTSDIPPHPILGDMLALTSACCFAVYVVLMKVKLGSEDRADMQMLLGFAGFSNVVLLAPLFPILHYTGIEPFELPKSKAIWVHCIVNMAICVSSDYIYMIAMLKTTPAVATIGLSLTIPLTLFCSFFIPGAAGTAITALTLGGAVMVCAAISILGWEGWKDSKLVPHVPVDEEEALPQVSH